MGLLSRIKGKSEKNTEEKSSFEIKDEVSSDVPTKVEIKSSDDIQREQVETELNALRSEISEKSSRLDSISEKLDLTRKEYNDVIAKTMEAKKLFNENKNSDNEIKESLMELKKTRRELDQASEELEKIKQQKKFSFLGTVPSDEIVSSRLLKINAP